MKRIKWWVVADPRLSKTMEDLSTLNKVAMEGLVVRVVTAVPVVLEVTEALVALVAMEDHLRRNNTVRDHRKVASTGDLRNKDNRADTQANSLHMEISRNTEAVHPATSRTCRCDEILGEQ